MAIVAAPIAARVADLIRPGMTVAVGDGLGAPRAVSAELSRAAARAGGVRLILGWVPRADPDLDLAAFADVRTFMPGWGLRDGVAAGRVRFAPVRLSAVPALLHGPWRPDLLVASLVPAGRGYAFGSEVSWQRAAIGAGMRAELAGPEHGSLGARIRSHRLVPYQAVIGPAEAAAGEVSVRLRDGRKLAAMPAPEALGRMCRQIGAHTAALWDPAAG